MPESILVDLTQRYCEPHRTFHTLHHIAGLLMNGRALHLSHEQILAIWYHDAIFDVHAGDSEVRSAALAVEQLSAAGYPAGSIELVERIVLDTVLHEPTIAESEKVLDLDLATLGGTWEEFSANTEQIRAEFAHLDDRTFEEGQARMARRFLERERIYHTEWGAQREERARRNLARSLGA